MNPNIKPYGKTLSHVNAKQDNLRLLSGKMMDKYSNRRQKRIAVLDAKPQLKIKILTGNIN